MKQFKLNVAARQGKGRTSSRRLRASGKIPAILYGKRTEPVQLEVAVTEFRQLLKSVGGSTSVIEINRPDGKPAITLIREVQKDPLTDEYLHVDLHELAPDEKMEANVSVRISGESYGVKNENGILEVNTHVLRVRCLPKDLPAFIEIDVTELHVANSIHVRELKPINGVQFVDNPIQPVVSCVEPEAEEVVATPAAGAEAAAAPAAGAAAPAADGKAAAPAAGDKKPADAKAAAPAAGDKKPAAAAKK